MKIAIISSMGLPVPAVQGGAVEQLTTDLIENNEKNNEIKIDLYTVYDKKIKDYKFNNTEIFYKQKKKIHFFLEKVINYLLRKFKIHFIFKFEWLEAALNVSRKKYDYILIENNMYLYKYVYKFYKHKETKFIYHMHNDINNDDKTPLNYKFIESTAYKILVVSEFLKKRLNKVKKTDKIEVLLNCIDLSKFNRPLNSKYIKEFKERYHLNEKQFIFLYLGRMVEEKGVLESVKAFNKLNNKNARILLVGEKLSFQNEFHKKVLEEASKNENCIICDQIENERVPEIMEMVDVVLIPTKCEEAFGMVGLEAICSKKIVIANESGGLTEVLDDMAILIKNRDLEIQLYKNMKKIMEDKQLRKKIIENIETKTNEKKYFEKYDKDNYLNNLLKKIDIEKRSL